MATKDDTTKAVPVRPAPAKTTEPAAAKDAAAKATADVKAQPDPPPVAEAKEETPRVSTCVVNDGQGQHVGNAVNGQVCSYHAMHYDRAGNRR